MIAHVTLECYRLLHCNDLYAQIVEWLRYRLPAVRGCGFESRSESKCSLVEIPRYEETFVFSLIVRVDIIEEGKRLEELRTFFFGMRLCD